MKYYISVNQIVLSKTKLDIKDAAILDYLRAFCLADDKNVRRLTIEEGGKRYNYTWINFNHLIKEMPLLGIKNKASISERIKKIEKEGFIKVFRAPDRSLYIRLLPKIKELEFYEGVSLNKQRCLSKLTGVLVKTNSTNNISYKHNINNNISKESDSKESQNLKDFNFYEKLEKLSSSKRRDLQIIALYWKYKGYEFRNEKQYQAALKRELRPAQMLEGYTDEEITQTMDWLCENTDIKWTLETVHKFIDEPLDDIEPIKGRKKDG